MKCVCVWLRAVYKDECIRGFGLSFSNPVGTWGVLGVCLCCGGVGAVCGKWACSWVWKGGGMSV